MAKKKNRRISKKKSSHFPVAAVSGASRIRARKKLSKIPARRELRPLTIKIALSFSVVIFLCLAAFFFVVVPLFAGIGRGESASVSYPLDSQAQSSGRFKVLAQSYRRTEEGFLIRVPEGGLAGVELTSPQSDIRWSQYPYLKIRFKPSEHPRKITVRWPPPSIDSTFSMSRQVPAGSAEALFNTYSYQPGSNKNPFSWGRFFVASPVGTVVVVFSEDFEIRGAELMRDVSYGEKLALIIEDLLNEEPLLVRTINGLAGHQVYGFLLIPFFGSALVLWLLGSGLLGRFGFSAIVLGGAMIVVVYDTLVLKDYWGYMTNALTRSAWHYDLDEERRSHYGEDFADLLQEFDKRVPPGSKVAFLPPRFIAGRGGETNWLWLHLGHLYQTSIQARGSMNWNQIKKADYVLFYHPADFVIDEEGRLAKRTNGKPLWKDGDHRLDLLYEASPQARLYRLVKATTSGVQ